MENLWLASFKVRVLPGSPIDFDGSDFMFGEGAGYSLDPESFKAQVVSSLTDGRLELIEFYQVSPAESAAWLNEFENEDKTDVLDLIEEVKVTKEFGFGAFRSSQFLKVHR